MKAWSYSLLSKALEDITQLVASKYSGPKSFYLTVILSVASAKE